MPIRSPAKVSTFLALLVLAATLVGAFAEPCSAQSTRPAPLTESVLVLAQEGTASYWLPYNAPRYDHDAQKFFGYFRQGGKAFLAESNTGLNGTWKNQQLLTGGPTPIITWGKEHFSFDHHWDANEQWYQANPLRSADGFTFEKTGDPAIRSGEDLTLLHSEARGEFLCYIRPRPPHGKHKDIRKIGLMTSRDFKTWSAIKTVLEPNRNDHPQKQFYSMSVVYDKKRKTYWGFLNVFQVKHDDGSPYPTDLSGEENAVRVQLCRSNDGENWQRCFDQQDFIAAPKGIMEQFAVAAAHEDGVYIYVIQSRNRHNIPGPDFYTTVRYQITFDDLGKFAPGK